MAKPVTFPWGRAALVAGVAALVHAGSLGAGFVYDDALTVLGNPSLRAGATFTDVLLTERFRALTNISYAVDHALWAFNPLGFHLTNLLLHAVATLLVFALARRWASDFGLAERAEEVATVAAGLFAVHPALTQAVSYVSGRAELWCGVFVLAGVLAFRAAVVEAKPSWLGAGLLCLVLGAASKEPAAMTPFLAGLWLWLRPGEAAGRKRALVYLGPIAAVTAALGVWRAVFFVSGHVTARGPWENLQLQAVAFWQYAALLVAPVSQSLIHPVRVLQGSLDAVAMAAAAGGVALVGLALWQRGQRPALTFGVLWFALLVFPAAAVVPLNEPMSEHRVYVASAGVFLALAALAARFLADRSVRIGAALLCVVLAGLTAARDRIWADPRKLWAEAAERAPDAWAAQYGLGEALRVAKDCAGAIAPYERAVALKPSDVNALLNLGICQATVGKYDAAYRAFAHALELEPKNPAVFTDLGTLALVLGNPATAKANFLHAAELDPTPERKARADAVAPGPDTRPWPP
jgi:hypothetical protein